MPQVLSFGDGTGYFGTELYPPAGRPRVAAHDESYRSSKGASKAERNTDWQAGHANAFSSADIYVG